jgi:hypothetical protein
MPQQAAVRRVFAMEDRTRDGRVGTNSAATGEASPLTISRFGMGLRPRSGVDLAQASLSKRFWAVAFEDCDDRTAHLAPTQTAMPTMFGPGMNHQAEFLLGEVNAAHVDAFEPQPVREFQCSLRIPMMSAGHSD